VKNDPSQRLTKELFEIKGCDVSVFQYPDAETQPLSLLLS